MGPFKEFLKKTPETVTYFPELEVIRHSEEKAWERVLGRKIDVPPPPLMVTPEVVENLKGLGFKLCFIPGLYIGTLGSLRTEGTVEMFLYRLQDLNPRWRRYESLSDAEKKDHSVCRNLREWYWQEVRLGNIPFPELLEGWAALEGMPKPSFGDRYEETPITEMLGLSDRFNVSWAKAQEAIQKAKQKILLAAGLPLNLEVRMPKAVVWNLLANRFVWGATNTFELTSTEYYGYDWLNILIIGHSELGGASYVTWRDPADKSVDVGFRLLIALGR